MIIPIYTALHINKTKGYRKHETLTADEYVRKIVWIKRFADKGCKMWTNKKGILIMIYNKNGEKWITKIAKGTRWQ